MPYTLENFFDDPKFIIEKFIQKNTTADPSAKQSGGALISGTRGQIFFNAEVTFDTDDHTQNAQLRQVG